MCIAACDGLKYLPDAIAEIWPVATVQLSVLHPGPGAAAYASKAHRSRTTKALRSVYTGPHG